MAAVRLVATPPPPLYIQCIDTWRNGETELKTRVQKWGNSLAVRIPRTCAAEACVTQESLVDITVENGALILRPVASRSRLDDLLAGITPENTHGETDCGPAR